MCLKQVNNMEQKNKYVESISFGSQILERLSNIEDMQDRGFQQVNDHLKELNGKVAKHNEWIARYDIRVAEEIPKNILETKSELGRINMRLAYWSGIIFGGMVVIEFIFKNYLH